VGTMIPSSKLYDMATLSTAHDAVDRWKAECENADARLKLARIHENMARLISQHEPVASLAVDRETLRHLLRFVVHGDLKRLEREGGGDE